MNDDQKELHTRPQPTSDRLSPPLTQAMPTVDERPGLSQMVSALKIKNFRLYTMSQLTSVTGLWMQRITQDWLVMELTGSVAVVGLLILMQLGPWLFLGLWGGVVVDRANKRKLIIISQYIVFAAAVTLSALAFSGYITVWQVFVLAGIVGIVSVFDQPARQVFVGELVGPINLRNAVSTNAAVYQVTGLIGPALAGFLIVTVGNAWSFTATAIASGFSIVVLWLLKKEAIKPLPIAPKQKGQVIETLRYAKRKPVIFWILFLLAFFAVFAQNWSSVLVAMANSEFMSGAQGFGTYNSAIAAGALVGAIVSMRRRVIRLRTFVSMLLISLILKLLSAFIYWEWLYIATIALAGFFIVLMWTAANPILQFSSNEQIRGRIMSLYLIIIYGGEALGAPMLGTIADLLGARVAIAFSAGVPLVVTVVVALIIAKNHGLKLVFKDSGKLSLPTISNAASTK